LYWIILYCTAPYITISLSYYVIVLYYAVLVDRVARTTYVDAVYCYRASNVVCRSVCWSVCHISEPWENGWTDQDAVWAEDTGGCYIGIQVPPWEGAILEKGSLIAKYRDFLPWAVQKQLNRSICRLGFWTWVDRKKHKCNHIRKVTPLCAI